MPGDGATHGLVTAFTVVEVPAGLVDEPVRDAARDPRRVVGRPGQQPIAVRSDEVIPGLRVITDRMCTTVVVRAVGEVDLRNVDGLAAALRAGVGGRLCAGPAGGRSERDRVLLRGWAGVAGRRGAAVPRTGSRSGGGGHHPRSLRALRVTGLDVLFAITSTLASAIRTDMSPEWTVRTRPLT
jgi:hypothetical protein